MLSLLGIKVKWLFIMKVRPMTMSEVVAGFRVQPGCLVLLKRYQKICGYAAWRRIVDEAELGVCRSLIFTAGDETFFNWSADDERVQDTLEENSVESS